MLSEMTFRCFRQHFYLPGRERRNKMETGKKKKTGLLVGGVLLLAVILVVVYMMFGPKAVKGSKTVTLEVINAEAQSEEFTLHTDAEYLGEALLAEELVKGEDSEFGLFVTEVNGITANADNQEWWCFTKAGGVVNTGIDTTPIADGDHFEATLTVGY